MFLLVASFAASLAFDGFQAARLPSRAEMAWAQIRPAIVTLTDNGKETGTAALIDDSGYFVAQSSSVIGDMPTALTSTGKEIPFTVVSQDRATMLVLLKTNAWVPGSAKPFREPSGSEIEGSQLVAVLPTGPLRMAFGRKHIIGLLGSNRRRVPLTEIRFEAADQSVGGALIFTVSGELVGSLNATLATDATNSQKVPNNFGGQQGGFAGQGGGGGGQFGNNGKQYSNSGPSEMTVAYTVSADYMRHVLDGFLSPKHSVEYAAMGVFCVDAVGGGALIQTVTPGSPADKAGLRSGDILLNIASNQIQDQFAFAAVMLQQKVGKKIALYVQRGPARLIVDVVPGKAAD